MNRFHVHMHVNELGKAIRFYADLFGAPPSVIKSDYAKWMLDDPRVNFAISERAGAAGIDHLGIQVERREELDVVHRRLESAGRKLGDVGRAECCYAVSDKGWVSDPAGVKWETFFTLGPATTYGDGKVEKTVEAAPEKTCCAPSCCASAKAA
jgi:catechol 2,3-dioxygenase-like lactoylglutathione lyase family enzyme